LLQEFSRSSENIVVHQNVYELLQLLSYGEQEGEGIPHRRDHLRKLISDKEIISAIWQGSVARPIQYRGHRKLREIRKQFAEIAGAEDHLPMPDWLKANDAR